MRPSRGWTLGALLGVLGGTPAVRAAPPAGVSAAPDIYAVIVGSNDGHGVFPDLHYADDDALRFYRLLRILTPASHLALFMEPDGETLLRNPDLGGAPPFWSRPERGAILEGVARLEGEMGSAPPGRETSFYFFYSGHGEWGRLFLSPAGGEASDLSAQDLLQALQSSTAGQTQVFIDACKSQSLFVRKGAEETGPDFRSAIDHFTRDVLATPPRIGIITSTNADSPAEEDPGIDGGAFSHVLLSGLAGAADADGDGRVSYDELMAFVALYTNRLGAQAPWFRPPGDDLRAGALDARGRGEGLLFEAGDEGHYVVAGADERVIYAEFLKSPRGRIRILVPPGRYHVLRVDDLLGGHVGSFEVLPGRDTSVPPGDFPRGLAFLYEPPAHRGGGGSPHPAGLGGFDAAGSLFRVPFAPEVVAALRSGYRTGAESVHPVPSSPGARAATLAYRVEGPLGPAYHAFQGLAADATLWSGGPASLGVRLAFSAVSQTEGEGRSFLQDFTAEPEGVLNLWSGGPWRLSARLGAGYENMTKVRRGAIVEGDPTAWKADAGGILDWTTGPGTFLRIEVGPALHFLSVDGTLTAPLAVEAAVGVGKDF